MKEKIKKIMIGYLPGFITGLIICGAVSVIAATYFPSNDVTYDNTASGLQSTNVQGAIDELYEVCFPPSAGDQIIEDNGLKKDPYECRYFFTGANPNNYITFNEEKAGWRIISVECDGTIKIIKDTYAFSSVWNNSLNSDWKTSFLNTYLNNTYYNSLSNKAQSQIVIHNFSIGAVKINNEDLGSQINEENSQKYSTKLGTATLSEFIRANSNMTGCGSDYLLFYNGIKNGCKETNWMDEDWYWWSITANDSYSSGYAVIFYPYANIINYPVNYVPLEVKPAAYLSSEIQITGGTGTESNPYTFG